MTTDDKPVSRRGIAASWLATIVVAMVVAPATGAIAWLASAPVGPFADAMSWDGLRAASFELGLVVPVLLAGAGIPIAYALLPRYGERLIGAVPTSPVAAHRHLRNATDRVARRQDVDIELRLHGVAWLGPVALPAPGAAVLLALPADLATLDEDAIGALITPVVHAARRRPTESRYRLAAIGPILAVHAMWRSLRWDTHHRVPILASLVLASTVFVPSTVGTTERLLAAPLLAATLLVVLAALWSARRPAIGALRAVTTRILGDPAVAVTSPAWTIDLRDGDDDGTTEGIGPNEAPA
ncbi:MAG: hypothetical protein AAF480_03645 [Actinomycetota bacterium]